MHSCHQPPSFARLEFPPQNLKSAGGNDWTSYVFPNIQLPRWQEGEEATRVVFVDYAVTDLNFILRGVGGKKNCRR